MQQLLRAVAEHPAPLLRLLPPAAPPTARTLVVLDSSWNPPTLAHLHLAATASTAVASFLNTNVSELKETKSNETKETPKSNETKETKESHRIDFLLLFATANADKAPGGTPPPHRLAMMARLAQRIPARAAFRVAITNQPIFFNKLVAITNAMPAISSVFFIVGSDTLIRILDPRYYPSPLSLRPALDAFFRRGGRFVCATRTSIDNIIVHDHDILSQTLSTAIQQGHFDPDWSRHIITIPGWDLVKSNSHIDPSLSITTNRGVPVHSISSTRARSLISDYWRSINITSSSSSASFSSPSIDTTHPIVTQILDLIDMDVFQYIIQHQLYLPTE